MARKPKMPRRVNPGLPLVGSVLPEREGFAKAFILANGLPVWGPPLEQALREGLSAAEFRVTRCVCLLEHPIVRIRMRGRPGISLREVRRQIRRAVKFIGYQVTEISPVTVFRSGQVIGAFVLNAEIGEGRHSQARG